MKNLLFTAFFCVVLLFAGCTEEQMQQVDEAARITNQVTQVGEQALESPAGVLVPLDWRFYITLLGALGSGLANAWQSWRKSQLTKTTKAIVRGIEESGDTRTLKVNIAEQMKVSGIYKDGKAIVNDLKTS